MPNAPSSPYIGTEKKTEEGAASSFYDPPGLPLERGLESDPTGVLVRVAQGSPGRTMLNSSYFIRTNINGC